MGPEVCEGAERDEEIMERRKGRRIGESIIIREK
jgi:hypothetical protein